MKNDTSCLLKSLGYDIPCKICNGKLTHRKLTKIYCAFKRKLLRKFAKKIGPQGICLVVTSASIYAQNEWLVLVGHLMHVQCDQNL